MFKLNATTVKSVVKTTGKFIEKNAPVIAAGAAIVGMVTAVVVAIKAGPECQKAIEEAEIKKNEQALAERMDEGKDDTPIVDLTWKEKGFIYAKHYWKIVLLVLLSAGCMIGSVCFSNKKIKAMAVIAAAAEANLSELEKATREVVGEKNFDKIKGQLISNKTDGQVDEMLIADTGNGKTLCFEHWYGTYFWSDIPSVKNALIEYKDMYVDSKQVYMEDLYHLLNIPEAFIPTMAGVQGHICDKDEGIENKPSYKPYSKIVKINGVEHTVYAFQVERPRTYDDLMNEAIAKSRFH